MNNADTATIISFDPTTYTAAIQPDNSITGSMKNVPVSRHLSPALLAYGARVAMIQSEFHSSSDALIVGVVASGTPIGANPNTASARVYNNAAISIPNAAQTLLTFNTRRFDTLGAIWSASDPGKLHINNPGLYVAWANVEFASNPNGSDRTVGILDVATNQFIAIEERSPVNGDSTNITVSSGPWLVTNPTSFQFFVFQNSGAVLSINLDAGNSPEFAVYQIG